MIRNKNIVIIKSTLLFPIISFSQLVVRNNQDNRFYVFEPPDKTLVQLDLGSSLTYEQSNFLLDSIRLAILHGRAFFQVINNTGKPFFVLADSSVIKTDQGIFNVNNLKLKDQRVDFLQVKSH